MDKHLTPAWPAGRPTLSSLEEREYMRVERDDRLLDVFPKETRDKGVELWEKWGEGIVEIVRLRVLPDQPKLTRVFQIPRKELEKALLENRQLSLESTSPSLRPPNP